METGTIIIGAGFPGLGMAIQPVKDRREDFLLLEKAGEVGGTWRHNTYPGCACDVPSHMYSYSFEQHPGWSASFSGQLEILVNRTSWPGFTWRYWLETRKLTPADFELTGSRGLEGAGR